VVTGAREEERHGRKRDHVVVPRLIASVLHSLDMCRRQSWRGEKGKGGGERSGKGGAEKEGGGFDCRCPWRALDWDGELDGEKGERKRAPNVGTGERGACGRERRRVWVDKDG
jgi:hypothetical protein